MIPTIQNHYPPEVSPGKIMFGYFASRELDLTGMKYSSARKVRIERINMSISDVSTTQTIVWGVERITHEVTPHKSHLSLGAVILRKEGDSWGDTGTLDIWQVPYSLWTTCPFYMSHYIEHGQWRFDLFCDCVRQHENMMLLRRWTFSGIALTPLKILSILEENDSDQVWDLIKDGGNPELN